MAISLLQLSSYVAFAIFIVAVLAKWKQWSSMPIHLRWELYPVPHEPEHEHGGSYFEEFNFWEKHREKNHLNEMKELFTELLFIKRVFDFKRQFWFTTYPFHLGIYLILGWFALLFVGGLTQAYAGIAVPSAHPWAQLIYYLTLITGSLGIILGTLGCAGVLLYRLFDEDMRKYSAGLDRMLPSG